MEPVFSRKETPILVLHHLSYSYHTPAGETRALEDISFAVYPGEFVAVVGPSGCGKSTLLNLIAGLAPAKSGEILVHEKELTPGNASALGIGYMLQQDHLFDWRTIWENAILGPEMKNQITARRMDNVNQLLKKYGLFEFRGSKPAQLSGGMRQRAALIRTLALSPEILLLDEPFSALDYQTRLMVSGDIAKIIRENHKTAILVTHNLSEAISLADRIIVLSSRPARVAREMEISLTVTDHSPLGYRSAPEFNDYFHQVWKELSHER